MMRSSMVIFFLAAIAWGCGDRKQAETNTKISYDQAVFRRASKDCERDSAHCATYVVNYPVFSGLDSAILHTIQSRIGASTSMRNPETKNWTMKEVAESFIKDYEEFQEEDSTSAAWYYKAEVKVETLTDTLITLSANEEYFTGGAHGGAGTYFINMNPQTGKEVKLDDILKSGYANVLLKEGEKAFRMVRDLADTTSFYDYGFEFPDNKFQLNDNYGFIQEGIVFFYNRYEIAPYAAGPTQIVIPYEKLRGWLK